VRDTQWPGAPRLTLVPPPCLPVRYLRITMRLSQERLLWRRPTPPTHTGMPAQAPDNQHGSLKQLFVPQPARRWPHAWVKSFPRDYSVDNVGATAADRCVPISCVIVCLEPLGCESDAAATGIETWRLW
jgi:hypothetical protein